MRPALRAACDLVASLLILAAGFALSLAGLSLAGLAWVATPGRRDPGRMEAPP